MPNTWFDALEIQAQAEEQNPHVLRSGDARLLVAEHGARVLACELPGLDENLFFTTDFTNADGSRGKLTGGDRLWIAPEIGYFWPTLDDALRNPKDTAVVPGQIDPAAWHDMHPEDEDRVELATGMELTDMRTGKAGKLIAQREIIAERSGTADTPDLVSMSFVVTHRLELQPDGTDDGFVAGAWDILQIPPGGTLICPTTKPLDLAADVRSYYEPFGYRHVALNDQAARFRIDGARRIKAGIRAEGTTGRMAYYRPLPDGRASLILRIFAPMPGESYCDVPITDPRNASPTEQQQPILGGDCFQIYNDDGDAFGGGPGVTFGEMEYHDPCVIGGQTPAKRSGTSVTHIVAGPADAVREWGQTMLDCAIEPLA
ncbi:MAG: hypothetical protein AAF916_01605 [Planctomycetota bacterium]